MSISSGSNKASIFSDINITPLTDIFLVLLIIMMVIAPMLDQQGLNLAVPKPGASSNQKQDNKLITVLISKDGNMTVDGRNVEKNQLSTIINKEKETKKEGVVIQANPDSIHQDVVFIMDTARSAGINNISLSEGG